MQLQQSGAQAARQVGTTGSGRYRRIVIAAAVLGSVLVVAVGGGYSASKALLNDSVAFAVDGKGLDRLNAATDQPDAEILDLAKGSGRIRSVHRDGQLYVVDTATNTVSRVDPATLEVGPTTPPKPGLERDKVTVIVGGGTSALVDRSSSTVQRLDPGTLAPLGDPIAIAGGLSNAVVDGEGVIWAATREAGTIPRIARNGRVEQVPVAAQGTPLTVTLVGDRPVAVDTEAGAAVAIDPASLRRSQPARLAAPPAGNLLVNAPDTPAPYLWLIDDAADALFRVDLNSSQVEGPLTIGAGSLSWGQPVVQGARVYAPNLGGHTLAVVDTNTLKRVNEVAVPGHGPDFDVSLEGGALWANDPTFGVAVVVDQQGNPKNVGKGQGEGRLPDEPDGAAKPEPGATMPAPSVGATRPLPVAPAPTTVPSTTTPTTAAPPLVAPAADAVVPDLNGLTRDAACAAIAKVKLSCQSTEAEAGKIGKVASQEPRAGMTLKPGDAVRIVIGLGIKVPMLQGVRRDRACNDLQSSRLRCLVQAVTLERGKTKDEVFEQQPAAETRADEGSDVTLRYWGEPRRLSVPLLQGKAAGAACAQVTAAGFFECKLKSVKTQPDPRPAPNTVIGQAPGGGVVAPADTPVVVDVYAPDPVTIPAPAASDDYASYCATLQALVLNCKAATTANVGPFVGAIATTAPASGATVYPGDAVTITRHTTTSVPLLVGSSPDAACTALANRRLACNRDNRGAAPDASTPLNQVITQSIAENTASDPASNSVTVMFYSRPWVAPPPPPPPGTTPPPTYAGPVPVYLLQDPTLDRQLYTLSFGCDPGWKCWGQLASWWAEANRPPGLIPVIRCIESASGVYLFTVSDFCTTSTRFTGATPVAYITPGTATGGTVVTRLCRDDLGPRRYLWVADGARAGWGSCNEQWYLP